MKTGSFALIPATIFEFDPLIVLMGTEELKVRLRMEDFGFLVSLLLP
jgi:hypothetical protein